MFKLNVEVFRRKASPSIESNFVIKFFLQLYLIKTVGLIAHCPQNGCFFTELSLLGKFKYFLFVRIIDYYSCMMFIKILC